MARSSTTVPKKDTGKVTLANQILEKNGSLESTYPYKVYSLKGITYLPHYLKHVYVSPGYEKHGKTHTEEELLSLGAIPKTEMLWLRSREKEATDAA
jgi:hypothetical protein